MTAAQLRHALRRAGILSWLLALPAAAVGSGLAVGQGVDIADLSIEELANLQITSVSKKPEPLAGAAASVYVITADDIRRSGATSLPEVLRLAPSLQVGTASNGAYAITARGLNGSNNSVPNKLQVLIDGRSVYSPLFSGVFWDAQDLVLEDIERIEVISGPGGTLWGVNAVNGVINITTRSAADSAGTLAVLAAGQRGLDAAFRQGGTLENGHWRVFGKVLRQRHSENETGAAIDDARAQVQLGFRSDWRRGAHRFSVHGNAYQGQADQPAPGAVQTGASVQLAPIDSAGANLTGNWAYSLADGGSVSMQGTLERTERDVPPFFAETIALADLQFQHSLAPRGRHALVWGASYRHTWDEVTNSEYLAFLPPKTSQHWASLFVQDEVTLGERLRLTAGARVERNDYTGAEFLPTLRLAWHVQSGHTLWASVSRTLRAPSRLDADAFIPGRAPFLLRGGPTVRSERALVTELGYRGQPLPRLSYAITAFHNDYDHLRTQEVDPSQTFVIFSNLMAGKARGIEMWGNYQATPSWRLAAGFMALHQQFVLKAGSNDLAGPGTAGKDPAHTAQLRSSYSFAGNKQFDLAVRKVGALSNPAVPGYTVVDARLGWRLAPGLDLALIARDLGARHGEYGPAATRVDVAPSLGMKLVWER